MENPEKSTT